MMSDSGSDSLGDFVDSFQTEVETDAEQFNNNLHQQQQRSQQESDLNLEGSNEFVNVSSNISQENRVQRSNSIQVRLEQFANSKLVKQSVDTAFFLKLKTKQFMQYIQESPHGPEVSEMLNKLDSMLSDHIQFAKGAKAIESKQRALSDCRHKNAPKFSTRSMDGALSYSCNEFAKSTEEYQKYIDKINAAYSRLIARPLNSLVENELKFAAKFRSEYLNCKLHMDNQNTVIAGYEKCLERMERGEPPFDPSEPRGKFWNQFAKFNKVTAETFRIKIAVAEHELVAIRASFEKSCDKFMEFMRIVDEKRNTEIVEYFRMFEDQRRSALREITEHIELSLR